MKEIDSNTYSFKNYEGNYFLFLKEYNLKSDSICMIKTFKINDFNFKKIQIINYLKKNDKRYVKQMYGVINKNNDSLIFVNIIPKNYFFENYDWFTQNTYDKVICFDCKKRENKSINKEIVFNITKNTLIDKFSDCYKMIGSSNYYINKQVDK